MIRAIAALAAGLCLTCQASGPSDREGGAAHGRVLSQNRYWAKTGKVEEVYEWRLHANDVRAQMVLPRGVVLRGAGGDDPDVIWQIEQTAEDNREFLRIQREKGALFRPVVDHMATLLRRFESSRYVEAEGRESGAPAAPLE